MDLLKHVRRALCASLLAMPLALQAQQTGSFNHAIQFMGASRNISCFVPSSYDPNVPARLVVGLHGMGDYSSSYRNSLVVNLGFELAFPNTILVCPDGGSDPSRDFYTPAGDEGIIQESIDYITQNYNIDGSEIILQGFSLGGRSALRYGLDHTSQFKALLLNTPAIQGVKDAVTPLADGGIYNYDAAPGIPIYITHGVQDVIYTAPIDSTYELLVQHNGILQLKRFNGNHTIPPFIQQQSFFDFIEQPEGNEASVDLVRLYLAPRSCDPTVNAKLLVYNVGNTTVEKINLSYQVDGTGQQSFVWTGSLPPFEHAFIDVPAFNGPDGKHALKVSIDSLDGAVAGGSEISNRQLEDFQIVGAPRSLPIWEDFSTDQFEEDWLIAPSGDYIIPWTYEEELGAVSCLNTIFIFDNSGRKEELLSPVMDLTTLANPLVAFDVSFNYTRFTADFLGVDTVLTDTLEVLVSEDCGQTYQSVYKKYGADLATFPSPILNPNGVAAYFLETTADDWRKERIDLSAFAQSREAIVKFRYISGLGGVIYLDNIVFTNDEVSIEKQEKPTVKVYPNPATSMFVVDMGAQTIEAVTIMDLSGRLVGNYTGSGRTSMEVPILNMSNGTFLVQVKTPQGTSYTRIVVDK